MEYSCSDCNYTSSYKHHVVDHFNRKKNTCVGEIIVHETEIVCEFCNKSYKSQSSLKRHQKSSCKVLKSDREAEKDKKIAELEAKLAKAEAKANSGPQTVINNVTNYNIIVNGYRETSFEHLTDRHFQRSIRRMVMSVPQMIQDVHFNPKVPENHNIYISNIKGKYAMVYDGKKWCVQDQDEAINQLINDQEYAMEDWLGEGEKYPHEMKEFNRYLEKRELDEVQNVIKQEVKMLLYNNRNLIKNKN